MIEVIKEGLLTTVQDLGRPGYLHLGIPQSGAMDRYALRVGNALVGNGESAAGLEAVFMGPELLFTEDTVFAVTGADLPPKLDGERQPSWTALQAREGQVLSFDFLSSGARAYLTFSGGIDTRPHLGSRSTYVIGRLGGVDGRPIAVGDQLPLGTPRHVKVGATVELDLQRSPKDCCELRVLPGLYNRLITRKAHAQFFKDDWRVALEADRMGYRFTGGTSFDFEPRHQPFGAGSDPSNIVDGCYGYGSIQVPSGTEPIVLHRDAVSGGGYFTIGAVISADMDLIGQLQPHAEVKFVEVDMETALQARRDRAQQLQRVRDALI